MQINVTVFIQIANFLVSMYFIRKYFYEPFLDHLAKKKHLVKTLSTSCETEKEKVVTLTTTSHNLVEQFQKTAIALYPEVQQAAPVEKQAQQEKIPLLTAPDDATIRSLAQALKEKVDHAFSD